MALAAGTKVGPYEIAAPLGAGGMGEVYRARDARLGRDVAVKVLPVSFAADPDRLRRFEQEARAAGLLNHPNILAVFDVGLHEGAPFVVSELLEGETLRERIGGAALPMRKAVDCATQIARGLAAAHKKGIVHRDVKPENVFVTRDGRVKLLDFGLAKLTGRDALAEAETDTHGVPAGTDAGTVLGTVGYMSPEQVRGRPVDHRSDLFSFGSVFYEMLSGRRAFRGASAVETMNAILREDPPELSETNRHLPPALERIVSHCLEKNPEERFQSASDIAFDLDQLSSSAGHSALPLARERVLPRPGLGLAASIALACAVGGYLLGRHSASSAIVGIKPVTFQQGLTGNARFAPDGKSIVYQAWWRGSATPEIFTTQPGSPESRSLGLEQCQLYGISQGGELLIVRRAGGAPTLARVPLSGGAPRDILENVLEADWTADAASVAVLRPAGARARIEFPIGKPLYEAISLRHLRVSPDGERVAFSEHPLAGDYRGDISCVDRTGRKKTLSAGWSDIRGLAWSPDGSEVWFSATRQGVENSLQAVTLNGEERAVFRAPGDLSLQHVARDGRVLVAVQRRRPTLYGRAPGETKERHLSWLDYGATIDIAADGKRLLFVEQGEGGGPEYATYVRGMDGSPPVRLGSGQAASLSADGRWALAFHVAQAMEAVLLPTGAGQARTLPRGPLVQLHGGGFFPDGKRVLLVANEAGHDTRFYVQDIERGDPKPITPEGVFAFLAAAITPDGTWVAGVAGDRILLYPTAGGEPRSVAGTDAEDEPLRVSGDGRYLFVRDRGRLPARIFRVDLVRGTREPWMELKPEGVGPGPSFIAAMTLTPDGKSYAYTFRDDVSTLYVAEGLR